MASYLRPRRGKEATAKSQNIVLKRGEVFFETPSGGVGTGIGKIKMGDGSTSYASLPYFLRQLDLNDNNTKCAFTNATAATDKSNNTTYLNNIAPSNNLKTLFQNIKQLLLNYNSQLTSLNNDLESFNIDNLPYKDLKVDVSNKNVSFKIGIRDIMQGLLIVTGALTGAQTYFTVICGVNSQYNDLADIASYATNGTVTVSNNYITIHANFGIDASNPISYIRIRLFA